MLKCSKPFYFWSICLCYNFTKQQANITKSMWHQFISIHLILIRENTFLVPLFFQAVFIGCFQVKFYFPVQPQHAVESHVSPPEKSIAIDQNIPGLPCAALTLQTAAPKFEKRRCYFLFLLHQTHPRSNVKLFKQGVTCSCPVGFDVRRCNNTKDVLKLRLPAKNPLIFHNIWQQIKQKLTVYTTLLCLFIHDS